VDRYFLFLRRQPLYLIENAVTGSVLTEILLSLQELYFE